MILCFSQGNNVEWCEIDYDYYLLIIKTLSKIGTICFKNYPDVGGEIEITFEELRRRLRFYDDYDKLALERYSKDKNILYGMLEELDYQLI